MRAAFVIVAVALNFLSGRASAQDHGMAETWPEIRDGLLSSFSLPLDDLLKKEHDSEWRNLFSGFSGSFALNYPFVKSDVQQTVGSGTQGESQANATVSATVKYNPLSYWFLSATFLYYLDKHLQAPWDPDFSYVVGYDDWHPYTLSLQYANYGGNRLNPDRRKGEKFTRFEEGTISLGWKYTIPQPIKDVFIVHESGDIAGSLSYNLTPRFSDAQITTRREWKQSISCSVKYTIYKWWYFNFTLYTYPQDDQQQPWDPDYTYGFGYFDWHPGTISVQYNNYSGNRYPWRKKNRDTGRFDDGSISVSWSWQW